MIKLKELVAKNNCRGDYKLPDRTNLINNHMGDYKSSAGITMVTLVVTVIVLLILAGITMNFALGENGIVAKAKQATELYKREQEKEQIGLNSLYTQLASNNTGGNIDTSEMTLLVKQIIEEERLKEYPVGSVYISQSERNPSEFIGGEWEQIKDTFLLSAGDTYQAGSIGGEATHKLTIEEMPAHNHSFMYVQPGREAGTWFCKVGDGEFYLNDKYGQPVSTTGGSKEHNNMPPYLTVYMYKRIS